MTIASPSFLVGTLAVIAMGVTGCGASRGDDDSSSVRPEEGNGSPGNDDGAENPALSGENEDSEPKGDQPVVYTPEDLVEAMRKTLLKIKSKPLAEGAQLLQFSSWKAKGDKDIGVELGIRLADQTDSARNLFCHFHGDGVMACHSIQAPGLAGNPQPFLGESKSPDPVDPIDPF